ncbi:MAG TPA: hypothetical protein VHV51_07670, partial [Polyangiaceae bacterium]|nr:hypothetical protein [Polyangiaceae bacterium]
MRVARSFYVLPILCALGLVACGGSPPPAANAPEPASAESAPAPAASADPAATKPPEEDGWAGENAAKNRDTKPAPGASDTAAPAPADGKAAETRTMDVIRQAVMDNRKAARKCYEDARKELKDLKGDVTIHFVLDPEGNVKSAELNQ